MYLFVTFTRIHDLFMYLFVTFTRIHDLFMYLFVTFTRIHDLFMYFLETLSCKFKTGLDPPRPFSQTIEANNILQPPLSETDTNTNTDIEE